MIRRYRALGTLLVAFSISRALIEEYTKRPPADNVVVSSDAESTLAIGRSIPLCSSDIYELELVPGISTKTAESLTSKRDDICSLARRMPEESRYRAFTIVPRIGEKLARTIANKVNPAN